MRNKGFSVVGQWFNIPNTVILDSAALVVDNKNLDLRYVCRDQGVNYEHSVNMYSPFDFHRLPIDPNTVIEILGECRQEFFIHTLFASLNPDSEDQIIAWSNHFGLPTYMLSTETLLDNDYTGQYQPIQFLDATKDEIYLFKLTVRICELISHSTTTSGDALSILDDIVNALGENHDRETDDINTGIRQCENCFAVHSFAYNCPYCGFQYFAGISREVRIDNKHYTRNDLQSWLMEDWSGALQFLLYDILELHLKGISPHPQFHNQSLGIGWTFDNLLSALYFMIAIDFSAKCAPMLCQNPNCGNFFSPSRESSIYCSPECQNRAKQHRFRMRNNIRILRKEGMSDLDICFKLKINMSELLKLIDGGDTHAK